MDQSAFSSVRDDHRQGRTYTLSHVGFADPDRHGLVGIDPDEHIRLERGTREHLRMVRQIDAQQQAAAGHGGNLQEIASVDLDDSFHSLALPCRAMNGAPDPIVGTTPADVARHRRVDVGISRVSILCQQGGSRHDLTGLAITALRYFFGDPCLLDAVAAVLGQPFDRRYLSTVDRRHWSDAGPDRCVIMHLTPSVEKRHKMLCSSVLPDIVVSENERLAGEAGDFARRSQQQRKSTMNALGVCAAERKELGLIGI